MRAGGFQKKLALTIWQTEAGITAYAKFDVTVTVRSIIAGMMSIHHRDARLPGDISAPSLSNNGPSSPLLAPLVAPSLRAFTLP